MVITTPSEICARVVSEKLLHQSTGTVWVPNVLVVENCHPILCVLVLDAGLVLGKPVHCIDPGLPVVLDQDVLGVTDLAGYVIILNTGPGV